MIFINISNSKRQELSQDKQQILLLLLKPSKTWVGKMTLRKKHKCPTLTTCQLSQSFKQNRIYFHAGLVCLSNQDQSSWCNLTNLIAALWGRNSLVQCKVVTVQLFHHQVRLSKPTLRFQLSPNRPMKYQTIMLLKLLTLQADRVLKITESLKAFWIGWEIPLMCTRHLREWAIQCNIHLLVWILNTKLQVLKSNLPRCLWHLF